LPASLDIEKLLEGIDLNYLEVIGEHGRDIITVPLQVTK